MRGLACVNESDLRAFLLGELPERVCRTVSDHLETCTECEAAARRLDALTDPVIRSLRRVFCAAADSSGPGPLVDTDDGNSAPSGEPAAQADTELPRRVAGYTILGELGRGGMGVVYLARQPLLSRLVALKMVLAGEHAGPERRSRFLAEADAIARLRHPNIVQVYEAGEHNGQPFLALEYIDGGTLADRLGGAQQPARESAALVEVLARAVQHAHEAGIVHRDLKPTNVLLANEGSSSPLSPRGRGERGSVSLPFAGLVPKITDFGLAKQGDAGLTATGAVLGTPSYMAPEQARGITVGPAADVWALGAILYECLTGRPPFQGESALDVLEQVRTREAVPPRQVRPKLPHDLETICLKCLQKEPTRRYATAAALADDLARFLAGRPVTARPVGALERAWRWCRRNPLLAATFLFAVLALLAVAGVSVAFAVHATRASAREKEESKKALDERDHAKREQSRAEREQSRAEREESRAKRRLAEQYLDRA